LDLFLILNILLAAVIVFLERKNPGATWAWLMVVLFLPYIGFILYLCIGLEGRKRNTFIVKSQMDSELFKSYAATTFYVDKIKDIEDKYGASESVFKDPRWSNFNGLVFLNFCAGLGFLCHNNKVESYHDGNIKFEQMLKDIQSAEKFIHLQYYIVRNDELGHKLIAALSQKASEGVEVRLLVDCMGKPAGYKKMFKPLILAGGYLGIFLPMYFIRVNYRNHRKICVIDGKIGYIGGLNIGDEYLGKSKRFGNWRDSHIRVYGNSAKELNLRFIMDWNYTNPEHRILLNAKYFPDIEDFDGIKMQIVSSGPDCRWPNIRDGYIKMIAAARKSIYIQTPYFVPDDSICETLRIAGLSGIDVRIMIPANPDHPFVYWAALSYLDELVAAGVKCYKYHNGFIHSKLVMVDGQVTSVGTANIDIRSFKLNFEINAFIYDEEKTSEFEKQFFEDIKHCKSIDREFYDKRGNWSKVKESVSRLISPLL